MARSILLDTNLLVVLVVGLLEQSDVGKHKRTQGYVPEDFLSIKNVIDSYQTLWITSQTVAETSNLLRQTARHREELLKLLSVLVDSHKESNMASSVIFGDSCVFRLGVTDAGIARKAKRVTNLLTADLDLYLEVDKNVGNAINFNHIRTGAWSLRAE